MLLDDDDDDDDMVRCLWNQARGVASRFAFPSTDIADRRVTSSGSTGAVHYMEAIRSGLKPGKINPERVGCWIFLGGSMSPKLRYTGLIGSICMQIVPNTGRYPVAWIPTGFELEGRKSVADKSHNNRTFGPFHSGQRKRTKGKVEPNRTVY